MIDIDLHNQQTNVPPFPELIHINLSYNQVRLSNRVHTIYAITAVHMRKFIACLQTIK